MAEPGPVFSRDDVVHVAALARLALTEEEVDKFSSQLASILEHVAAVRALDTEGVPPTSHPIPSVNVLREDETRPCLSRDEVLSQAPASESGRFKVPPILGETP